MDVSFSFYFTHIMTPKRNSLLNDIGALYKDPKKASSFSGLNKIYITLQKSKQHKNVRYKDIKPVISKEETYQLYKPAKKKIERNKVITSYRGDQLELDLIDMTKYSKHNDNIKYILSGIDVFSRFGYAIPLLSKSQNEVLQGIKKITDRERFDRVRSDKGGEFSSKKLDSYFKSKKINHFFSNNDDIKCAVVERFNKTLKSKIVKYMYQNQTYKYIDILDDILKSYNSTIHRSTQMRPKDVNKATGLTLWAKEYMKKGKTRKKKTPFFKYEIGNYVRLSRSTNIFSREYDQKWTGELFKIVKRYPRQGLPFYEVDDYDGEKIEGSFYESELQRVDIDDNPIFKIEKIIQTKGRGSKKQHLVRWLGWPPKYDSYISESDIKDIKDIAGSK